VPVVLTPVLSDFCNAVRTILTRQTCFRANFGVPEDRFKPLTIRQTENRVKHHANDHRSIADRFPGPTNASTMTVRCGGTIAGFTSTSETVSRSVARVD